MHLVNDPAVWFKELFVNAGLSYSLSSFLNTTALVLIVITLSWLSNQLAKAIILKVVTRIVKKTTTTWDDIFLEQKVFTRLSHLAPALVIWFLAGWALKSYPSWLAAVHKFTYIYMVLVGMIVLNSFIEAWHEIYKTLPLSKNRHIKGYIQLLKIFVIVFTILIIISVIFKVDIGRIVTGLGAMAAVLILVFRDALLGLVASIQLSADKMLKVGDWISVPRRDVDGLVTDITLTTVKVQNFDKTLITIPTYSLVNDSFQNWKGMEEAGIRQIKRSLYIDSTSVRFIDTALREKLSVVPALKEYIGSSQRMTELTKNSGYNTPFYNSSQITNLGAFRFYAETYLKQHPLVDTNQAILMKHRAHEVNGIQMQLSLFAKGTQMMPYENLQSEIMEHLLAIMSEFGLRIFQQPTGNDLQNIIEKLKN
jgi:miniconductance mechanosensitive channel